MPARPPTPEAIAIECPWIGSSQDEKLRGKQEETLEEGKVTKMAGHPCLLLFLLIIRPGEFLKDSGRSSEVLVSGNKNLGRIQVPPKRSGHHIFYRPG